MDLEKFARKMFELSDWPDSDGINAFEFQDAAVECGLLIPEIHTEPCRESCFCAEYHGDMSEGVTCYRKVPFLIQTDDAEESPR